MSDGDISGNTLSDRQEIALSLMYVISSVLSLLGSSTIVYKVIANRRRATSYDRLMLGLSSCDLVASVGYAMYPFFAPSDTSPRVWAIGSEASCSFVGFLTQFGFAAIFYNGFLSFYYVLTVRYGMKRQFFAQRYEALMHAFSLLFSFITATIGASKGFFSEVQVGMGCWVNDFPKGCTDNCLSEELGLFYAGTPIFFALFALVTNNTLVYLHVRRVFRTSEVVETDRTLRQKMQKREVAVQGFLYVASWFFCFWSAIAVRSMEAFSYAVVDESKIYWILMFQGATLPLQGFLNMFIYNRPNYKRLRKAFPEISVLAAIRKACLDSQIPKLTEISKLSGSMPKSNKYKQKPGSGSAFSSSLQIIVEASDEDDVSNEERDLRDLYLDGNEKVASGLSQDGEQIRLSRSQHPGVAQTLSSEDDVYSPESMEEISDDDLAAQNVENAPEEVSETRVSAQRISMDGAVYQR